MYVFVTIMGEYAPKIAYSPIIVQIFRFLRTGRPGGRPLRQLRHFATVYVAHPVLRQRRFSSAHICGRLTACPAGIAAPTGMGTALTGNTAIGSPAIFPRGQAKFSARQAKSGGVKNTAKTLTKDRDSCKK